MPRASRCPISRHRRVVYDESPMRRVGSGDGNSTFLTREDHSGGLARPAVAIDDEDEGAPLGRLQPVRLPPGRNHPYVRSFGISTTRVDRRRACVRPSRPTSTCARTDDPTDDPDGPRRKGSTLKTRSATTLRARLLAFLMSIAVLAVILPSSPASAAGNQAIQLNGSSQYVTMGASPGLRSRPVHRRALVQADRCRRRDEHRHGRHRVGDPADHEGPGRGRDRCGRHQLLLRHRRHDRSAGRRFRGGAERRLTESQPSGDGHDGRHLGTCGTTPPPPMTARRGTSTWTGTSTRRSRSTRLRTPR